MDVEIDDGNTGLNSPELRHRAQGSNSPNIATQRRSSIPRSLDDMSDIGPADPMVNENNMTYTTEMAPGCLNIAPRSHRLTYPTSLIKPTSSSPNLLNEICEENESDFEESPRNSPKNFRRQPRRQRKFDKKRPGCRLSPIHSRRSSCSSSDDEELQKLDRRLNIQVAISAGRILANVPENSGDKEIGGDKNGCHEGGKETSLDLLEKFIEAEKESSMNYLNILDGPNKLFVTSVSGRVRNLSDTNLVSYQARYRLPILKNVKCSSDTNLAINGKKALIQRQDSMKLNLKPHAFGISHSPTLSSASPIEEENPSDISPDSSPVSEPKHGKGRDVATLIHLRGTPSKTDSHEPDLLSIVDNTDATGHSLEPHAEVPSKCVLSSGNSRKSDVSSPGIARKKQTNNRNIDADDFSSIQEPDDENTAQQLGLNLMKDSTQSCNSSRSSLKYHYSAATSTDDNPCYTIAESRPVERADQPKDPSYSVGKIGRMVVNRSITSKCCAII